MISSFLPTPQIHRLLNTAAPASSSSLVSPVSSGVAVVSTSISSIATPSRTSSSQLTFPTTGVWSNQTTFAKRPSKPVKPSAPVTSLSNGFTTQSQPIQPTQAPGTNTGSGGSSQEGASGSGSVSGSAGNPAVPTHLVSTDYSTTTVYEYTTVDGPAPTSCSAQPPARKHRRVLGRFVERLAQKLDEMDI